MRGKYFRDPDDEFDIFCFCGRMRGGKIFLNLKNPSTVLFAVKGIPVKGMLSTAMGFGPDVSALNRVRREPLSRAKSPHLHGASSHVLQVNSIFVSYLPSYSTWAMYRSQLLW